MLELSWTKLKIIELSVVTVTKYSTVLLLNNAEECWRMFPTSFFHFRFHFRFLFCPWVLLRFWLLSKNHNARYIYLFCWGKKERVLGRHVVPNMATLRGLWLFDCFTITRRLFTITPRTWDQIIHLLFRRQIRQNCVFGFWPFFVLRVNPESRTLSSGSRKKS